MNEYLEEFRALQSENTFRGEQWFGSRQHLVEEYSWAVPGEDVLLYLSNFCDIVEIGAGNGYWASLLHDEGVTVHASDIDPPEETHHDVEKEDFYQSSPDLSDRAVMLIWPPYDTRLAEDVAREGPAHLLYVGEPRGGCTANDGFFDVLKRRYGLVATIDIPSYVGVNDQFYHYVRKV